MSEFNFNSQVCTSREQSERLLKLGLKKETADCCHRNNSLDGKPYTTALFVGKHSSDIPAWSLARLIEMVASKWQEYMVFLPDAYDEIISDIEIEIGRGDFPKEYLV